MKISLSILLIIGIIYCINRPNRNAMKYGNIYQQDYEKMNEDRYLNNLSNRQVNQNILSGKYNTGRRYDEKE